MKQYVTAKGIERRPDPVLRRCGRLRPGCRTRSSSGSSPPIGVFPYLVSQTTYQAPIQTAEDAAKPGQWAAGGFVGTGPFKVKKYTEGRGADLVRHTAYWGGPPPLDGVKMTFFTGSAPLVLALRAGQIDLAMQLSPQEAQPFKNNSKYTYYALPTSAHRQFCMRTDQGVLKDPRVRRAVALTINRPQQLAKIMLGAGQIGNDSPFWKGFAVDRPVDQAAHAERPAREGAAAGSGSAEPEVHPHDVELPRPSRIMRRRSRPTRATPASTSASR